jgi:hypothetical protein
LDFSPFGGKGGAQAADLFLLGSHFVFELLIQSLYCRESHARFIDLGNVLVVCADVESGIEILRHGAQAAKLYRRAMEMQA